MQHHISQTEWWLCYEAWKVITCSRSMRNEVQHLFSVPGDKIKVIPNGIADSWFQVKKRPAPEPMVLYVGRLVPEKGPHVLVQAMMRLYTLPCRQAGDCEAGPWKAISRIWCIETVWARSSNSWTCG